MATTRVYTSRTEFRNRPDKKGNGVSEEVFASRYNGDMDRLLADNADNRGCWDCTGCEGCTDCTDCWDCFECEECVRTIGRSFRRGERAA